MRTTYRIFILLALAVITAGLSACQEDRSQEWNNPRLFMPTDLTANKDYNGMIVRWSISYGADGYRVELSKDAAFGEITATQDLAATDGKSYQAAFADLEEQTLYYIRLCAIAKDETLDSKYIYGECTTGIMRSVFNSVDYQDMTYTSATLSWTEDLGADEILISTSGKPDVHRTLTTDEAAQQQALVTGLKNGVKYKASFIIGDKLASYIWFTLPKVPGGSILITNEDDLKATVEQAPAGTIVLLTAGQTYDYSDQSIDLQKTITIQAAPGGAKPLVYVKSFVLGGTTEAASAIDSIRIEGLEISGFKPVGGIVDPASEPNAAMLSFDATATARNIAVGKLTLSGCIIRNYTKACLTTEYALHAQTRIRFGLITVNDVMAYDLGRDVDNVNSLLCLNTRNDANDIHCDRYVIRNSTFRHLYHGLIEARCWTVIQSSVATPTVEVTNCTFDYMGMMADGVWVGTKKGGQRYLFEFLGYAAKANITLTHSIFGEVRTNNNNIRPLAFNNATLTCSTTYKSTDCTFDSKFTATGTGMTAVVQFPSRAQFDFTPTSDYANFHGNGDPRWQK